MPARRRRDLADQPVVLAVDAGGEVQILRIGPLEHAELQRPQPIDRDRLAIPAAQLAEELATVAERVDPPVAEVADQDRAAEPAEAERRAREAPRRVERPTRREPPDQLAAGGEHVDEAQPGPGDVVLLLLVLLGERHEQLTTDVFDAERREARRDVAIDERELVDLFE